jgi:VanZ family protein
MKYLLTTALTLLILVAVSMPGSKIPSVGIGGLDKVVHLTLFFLWSVAIRYDFSPNFKWLAGLAFGFCFSLSTEVLQIFVEGRTFSLWDILFDTLGLMLGLMVGRKILRWIPWPVKWKEKVF